VSGDAEFLEQRKLENQLRERADSKTPFPHENGGVSANPGLPVEPSPS